ncbi:MAG: hypothetical protein ACNA8K_12075 [Cyclonatronaceae bacterium]
MDLNFYNLTCFAYAAFAIFTRFLMVILKEKWNQWELDRAYTQEKPAWIYVVAGFSVLFVTYSWYRVWTDDMEYGWILAALLSITLIKVSQLMFNYDSFRMFVKTALDDKRKMMIINTGVIIFSVILIFLGVAVYS